MTMNGGVALVGNSNRSPDRSGARLNLDEALTRREASEKARRALDGAARSIAWSGRPEVFRRGGAGFTPT